MLDEAKLGLVVGVGVVLAIALVYFKPAAKSHANAAESPPAQVQGAYRPTQLSPLMPASPPAKK